MARYLFITFSIFIFLSPSFGQGYNGLVGIWKFNGNVSDSSGNDLHGIPYNITYTEGINGSPNTAAKFDGLSSYIEVPYDSLMNTKPHSFCAVIKPTGFHNNCGQGNAIIWRGAGSAFSYQLVMFDNAFDGSDGIFTPDEEVFAGRTGLQSGGPADEAWYYASPIDTGIWYKVVLTFESDTTKVYVDGNLVNALVGSGTFQTTTNSLLFGKSHEGACWEYWLNAVVDEIRFYDRPLTPTEVMQFSDSVGTTSITGIPTEISQLRLFPNPANTILNIASEVPINKVHILNVMGQVVLTSAPRVKNVKLYIEYLPQGMYYVRADETAIQMFIKR